jgi:UDP-N-acetylmuramoyl-L-alanyl-D-glutamate--2,6-diaminopimelate ligase
VISDLPRPEGWQKPWIEVEHGRRALATAARRFYRAPDERIAITAITGTNGKTTTAFLIDSILRAAGKTTALVGTIEYHVAGRRVRAVNTTPDSLEIYRLLADLERECGSHAIMEVSSHALALGRVWGVRFDTAVFTNLTRDHLDFHRTMEDYFAAKRLLFEGQPDPPRAAVLNSDDSYGRQIKPASSTRVLNYGIENTSQVTACGIESSFEGLRFMVGSPAGEFAIESALVGRPNVYNILAACAAALAQDIENDAIVSGIAGCRGIPGRFERVEAGQPFLVVVDYAHTDDALRNAIRVARGLTGKRVITLFGCGGDRDRSKRPLMGMAAAELSDYVVLTSDNPRSEDPLDIINDALVGLRRFDTPHSVEPDREKAIALVLGQASPGDVVIIAGKGHETYQILKDRTIEFDDREVAMRVLTGLGYMKGST